MSDYISRQDALDGRIWVMQSASDSAEIEHLEAVPVEYLKELPSAQPERLTDDDFETIRIHLNAYKENLCNQRRWEEAEEYQRIIDRFMAFASAQSERPKGHWIFDFARNEMTCSECGRTFTGGFDLENADNFCRHCGSDNRGEQDG